MSAKKSAASVSLEITHLREGPPRGVTLMRRAAEDGDYCGGFVVENSAMFGGSRRDCLMTSSTARRQLAEACFICLHGTPDRLLSLTSWKK